MRVHNRRSQSQPFCSVWFIVSEQSWGEFSLVSSASLKISSRVLTLATLSFLEIARQRVHQAALIAVELAQPSWILPGLRIVLDDVIDGTVETISHAASEAITSARILSGYRYLISPALVGHQAVEDLLPDAFLMRVGTPSSRRF